MTEVSAPKTNQTLDVSLIITGIVLIIVSGYSIWSTSYTRKSNFLASGKITQCLGGCKYKSPDDYFWLSADKDLAVLEKSMVFTPGQSTASILLNSGSKLTLYPNSLVQITTTKKGAIIDIIEGKINFDKSSQSVGEIVTIKGKEIIIPDVMEETTSEISVEPELLEVQTPEMIYLRSNRTAFDVHIKNGVPPFKAYLEGMEQESQITSSDPLIQFKLTSPGVFSLKISDAKNIFVTKMLTVVDLTAPLIGFPVEGDFVYKKSFRPAGPFDVEATEFNLTMNGADVYTGTIKDFPKALASGPYHLSARKFKDAEKGEWSKPISFQLIETKNPRLLTPEGIVFFNQVALEWKKALPVIHQLTIKNENSGEIEKLTLSDDQFLYSPKTTGVYSWTIRPLDLLGDSEKEEWRKFSFIETSHLLMTPKEKEHILSESLEEEVTFNWVDFPQDGLSVYLEVRDQKNKKTVKITNQKSHSMLLKNLMKYRWSLVLKSASKTIATPEWSFEMDPPPPVKSIKSDEIILIDSD